MFIEEDKIFPTEDSIIKFAEMLEQLGETRIIGTSRDWNNFKKIIEESKQDRERRYLFQKYNLKLYGYTPYYPGDDRQSTIKTYIELNGVKDYVILDTELYYFDLNSSYLIRISREQGFCERNVKEVLSILENKMRKYENELLSKIVREDEIICRIRPVWKFKEAGSLLIAKLNLEFSQMPEVGVNELVFRLGMGVTLLATVKKEKLEEFLDKVNEYTKMKAPFGNILEINVDG